VDFDDPLPPPDDWFEESYQDSEFVVGSPTRPSARKSRRPRTAGMGDEVFDTFCVVIASIDQEPASQVANLCSQIRVSSKALDELDDDVRRTVHGVLELLEFEVSLLGPESPVSISDLAAITIASQAVSDAVAGIRALPHDQRRDNPIRVWQALVNEVQSRHTRRQIDTLARVIDERHPIDEQLTAYDKVEPPATRVAVVRENGLRTVDQLLEEFEAAGATTGERWSSGFPALDAAMTAEGEEPGIIAPGENMLILGPTGTGKSSIAYALQRAMTLDLVLRYPDAVSALLHTEEETTVKARAIGLGRGQRWHFLAKNILIENIGSSRRRIGELFCESVAHSVRRSDTTGRHPREFMLHELQIDYVQAIGEQGENEQTSVINTSELILRGLQACNPEEVEKYSGVSFTRYTGMKWPEELEHHRIAVVTYGQLRKSGSDAVMFFDPTNKRHSLNQFTLEDTSDDPAWVDSSGNKWCWEVRPGDYRIFTKDDIYGSSKPLQNATSVLLLHRSRPQKNPVSWHDELGHPHLTDTRSRLILDKARNGQQALYVPMAFDVMPDGFRAQYFDVIGQKLLGAAQIKVEDFCSMPGDPMIPVRGVRSPFADLRY
jgi:hypothetical protein